MDEQFLKRLHTLNRRDELRSKLLIDGAKFTLERNKKMGWFARYLKNKKKAATPAKY